jgi:hypothetical protein
VVGATGVSGTARRLRNVSENAPVRKSIVMIVVVCSECGERFAISHEPASQDAALAGRQAAWLREIFTWDHIQETKHRGSITLPSADEIK